MQRQSLCDLSIAELGRRMREGATTSAAVTEAALARISARDPRYNSFVAVTAERALEDARRADADFSAGRDRGPMQGIPYALKDMIDTAGIRTTAHSRLLLDNVPEADAVVAQRLRQAGGVLLGKLATYEFALVGPDENLPFPPARNPWNTEHITGGSSSGPAAAVAGGLVRTAIGTDTGGSIRSPACACGVTGLKPTYGLVSMAGIIPLSPSLDHAGPLSATVDEAALTLDVIAGSDPAGAGRELARSRIGRDLRGLRLAYARSFHASDPGASPEVVAALDDAASQLSMLGASIHEVDLPDYALFEACGAVILQAEAYAGHQRDLQSRAADYGRLALQTLASGFALTAADVAQAQRVRRHLALALQREVFSKFDALIAANVLASAGRFENGDSRHPRWTAMRTLPFNLSGNPALAVPVGFARNGLPLGMQIAGRPFSEALICQIGAAYEAATGWSAVPAPCRRPCEEPSNPVFATET